MKKPLFLWSAWALCAAAVFAAPNPRGLLTIHSENDLFDGTDRWNTTAQSVEYATPAKDRWEDTVLPFCLSAPARWIPWMNGDGAQKIAVFNFAQEFFTPADQTRINPDPQDRPYAGWLYAGLTWVAQTRQVQDALQLSLGVVGPYAFAEQTQRFVHDHISDSEISRGWDYQLPNEPAFLLAYTRTWRVFERDLGAGWKWDVLPRLGVVAGNVYDYASAGATLRFGRNIPDDFGPQRVAPNAPSAPAFSEHAQSWSYYIFFGFEGRAVARNIFLDGSTFKDSRSVGKYPLVADLQAGVCVRYGRASLAFSQLFRTKEFTGQWAPQWYCAGRLGIEF